jgi:hypothetical protein
MCSQTKEHEENHLLLEHDSDQTYNVWSCEHVAVYRRIQSICEIIEHHVPDVIFLQVLAIYYAIIP